MNKISDLDRKGIISLLKKGKTTEEVVTFYNSKYTKMQIAAQRAWITMRKPGFKSKKAAPVKSSKAPVWVAVLLKSDDSRLKGILG